MNTLIQVRRLTSADLEFADRLREKAGWNHLREDWRSFLDHEPQGCFLAECEGTSVGTATTITYGGNLAWIGMVLVDPQFRRRGVGRGLLSQCVEYLVLRQIRCIKLDATPAGKQLYDQVGFQTEWSLKRWERMGVAASSDSEPAGIHEWQARDPEGTAALDQRAFGADRGKLLRYWASTAHWAVTYRSISGQVRGFGMLRPGANAAYLGPVVAEDSEAGKALIYALLTRASVAPIYWDIPEPNTAAAALARELGFVPQRPLHRMVRGANANPGSPLLQFAIGDPATG